MNYIRQIAAVAVASGVAVASLALPSAAATGPSAAATGPSAANAGPSAAAVGQTTTTAKDPAAAAAYLVGKFAGKHHDHLTDTFDGKSYADDGETADAVLSIDAAGVAQRAAKRATRWLEKDATNYAGSPPDVYPGSAAKLLLVAEAQHVDPQAFGSIDLIGALVGDEGAGGAATGQYQNPDDPTYGSSVLDQALAVLALANTVDTAGQPSEDAVGFLAGQQCADGAFEVDIRTDTSTDCSPADKDVDTTAYAVQALVAAGHRAVAATALHWLATAGNSDGGWGETNGARSDANSTSIVLEALVAAHRSDAKPARWLTKHQLGCSDPTGRRGAVRLQGKYDAATAVRATSQAGVALAGESLAQVDKNGASAATPVPACPKHHHHNKHHHKKK